jgi:hypothetical protein
MAFRKYTYVNNALKMDLVTFEYFVLYRCVHLMIDGRKPWAKGQDTSLGNVAADAALQSHTMSVWFKKDFRI